MGRLTILMVKNIYTHQKLLVYKLNVACIISCRVTPRRAWFHSLLTFLLGGGSDKVSFEHLLQAELSKISAVRLSGTKTCIFFSSRNILVNRNCCLFFSLLQGLWISVLSCSFIRQKPVPWAGYTIIWLLRHSKGAP